MEATTVTSYLDTNVVIRLESGLVDRISDRAKRLIEASDLFISGIVMFELEMLHEIGKLSYGANWILANLAQKIGLRVCQLPMSTVVSTSLDVKWTRDPGDRLIVANAIANNEAPLITSDRNIQGHYRNSIW